MGPISRPSSRAAMKTPPWGLRRVPASKNSCRPCARDGRASGAAQTTAKMEFSAPSRMQPTAHIAGPRQPPPSKSLMSGYDRDHVGGSGQLRRRPNTYVRLAQGSAHPSRSLAAIAGKSETRGARVAPGSARGLQVRSEHIQIPASSASGARPTIRCNGRGGPARADEVIE